MNKWIDIPSTWLSIRKNDSARFGYEVKVKGHYIKKTRHGGKYNFWYTGGYYRSEELLFIYDEIGDSDTDSIVKIKPSITFRDDFDQRKTILLEDILKALRLV